MFRFNNDYNRACHEKVFEAIKEIANDEFVGYGRDEVCEEARKLIQKYLGTKESTVHFLIGGTQVNFISIDSMIHSFQSVIAADSGHIFVHETGAIERTGHKVEIIKSVDGKITAKQVDEYVTYFKNNEYNEHITMPKALYISQPTEFGTIYSKKELMEFRKVCDKHSLYFYIDGARLAYALGAKENDMTLKDLAKIPDMFYIGGTKCGAMFGEALVINNKNLQGNYRSYMKQSGALLAKGFLLGAQFKALFTDDLYLNIGKKAVDYAQKIKKEFLKKGIKMYIESPSNQLFLIVDKKTKTKLAKRFIFEEEGLTKDKKNFIIRFCTSWSTTEEEVDELLKDIKKL